MKRTSLFFSEVQLRELQRLATKRGRPVSELIRQALDEFIDRHTAKRLTRRRKESR